MQTLATKLNHQPKHILYDDYIWIAYRYKIFFMTISTQEYSHDDYLYLTFV